MEYKDLFEENKKLKEEVLRLREENDYLKSQISKKNQVFNDNIAACSILNPVFESNCTYKVTKNSSIEDKIKLYRSLFKGREDLFALRWEYKDIGKDGYSPYCSNIRKPGICDKKNIRCGQCGNRSLKPLDDEDIKQHLSGIKTIGIYPLLKGDMCNFFAVDFDGDNWQGDVKAVYESFKKFELFPSIEISRSGNGAHLWIFFEEPVSASKARHLGDLLMKHTMEHNFGISLGSYDRFFPNQDKMPKGNFGNLIALPLQRIPAKEKHSLFVDEDLKYYPDQWIYLSNIKRNKSSKVAEVIAVLEDSLNASENSSLFKKNEIVYKTESKNIPHLTDYQEKVEIIQSNGVIINTMQLPRELINEIKKLAIISNPEFYKRQALRLYLEKTPRNINCFDVNEKLIIMPRGCLEEIINLFERCKINYNLKEELITGNAIEVEFEGTLYENQLKACSEVLKYDYGILHASTAFGKTVAALNIIAERKVSTLIIVNSIELLEQWETKVDIFLDLGGRKTGKLGAGKKKPSQFIDIATVQTLYKAENLNEILNSYGMIIIDECHHMAAFTFEKVLKQCKTKFILGLTATIKRKDGLERIVEFQCGKIRYTDINKSDRGEKLAYAFIPRKITLKTEGYKEEKFKISAYYELIQKDEIRNNLIISDVMGVIKEGRNPIVLTERLEHLEYLEGAFTDLFARVIVLKGGMGVKQRQEVLNKLRSYKEEENYILISTGKYIGEGFDNIRLDTLFLTMPISWEGTLKQYAGRLHRMCDGKQIVKIYDYIDGNVPALMRMFKKREKGYKNMGYELEINAGIQNRMNFD